MKIPAHKVDGFINTIEPKTLGILLYGPDAGLVGLRAEAVAKKVVKDVKDPFAVVDLTSDRLKDDPAILLDEFNAISFGGGRRLIRIKGAENSSAQVIKGLFTEDVARLAEGGFLLVTAGELDPRSALRKLFEETASIAALPCYMDDQRGLEGIVADTLRKKELKYDHDVIAYIAANCQGDRMIVQQEIEKLELYLGEQKNVKLEDAIESIGKTTETTLDDICHAVADGNLKLAERHFNKAMQQGVLPIPVLRALERYLMRIRRVNGQIQAGQSQEAAMGSLRPPVFFKHKPAFSRHVNIWSRHQGKRLDRALSVLYDAETECKKSGSNPELIGDRCLMKIASLAG